MAKYDILIALIFFTILTSILVIINDESVVYARSWFYLSIFFNICIICIIFYLLKNNSKIMPKTSITTSKSYINFIFIITSLYLIMFGLSTLYVNEIKHINETNILYFYKNQINDNISIYSIVVGILSILLILSDSLF